LRGERGEKKQQGAKKRERARGKERALEVEKEEKRAITTELCCDCS